MDSFERDKNHDIRLNEVLSDQILIFSGLSDHRSLVLISL